ncbi:MAG: hypothetical protein GC137_05045 [Alphaproteobacteria bacterium]|nr:hypothetical protein [Alphaproteobacteria bacterium]
MNIELEKYVFEGAEEGVNFTVLGAIHGNEKCGTRAIRRVLEAVDQGKITFKKGKVTFMPICNPRAYEEDKRYIERNLNRFMSRKENPQRYEDHIDNVLCPVLEETDYLLDLHSYTSPGDAFVLLDTSEPHNLEYGRAVGVPCILYGWAEALKTSADLVDEAQAIGTCEYVRAHGGNALTLECGTHDHPRAADVGFQAIINLLRHFDLADVDKSLDIHDLPSGKAYEVKMINAHLKLRDGDFVQDWRHMDHAAQGTVVARYEDGKEVKMPEDAFILLPKRNTEVGHEWFFWGVAEKNDTAAA